MSRRQKSFFKLVASILIGVLLAALVVTANADSCSVMRHANISLRAGMYVSLLVLMKPELLVGGPAYVALSFSFTMACNRV